MYRGNAGDVMDLEPDERVHIVPENDLREHLVNKDCWCNPDVDEEFENIIIHHALDGRDLYETGERRLL